MRGSSRARIAACATALATAIVTTTASTQDGTRDLPRGDALKRILRLGPWPESVRNDPSNRASGNPDAAAFGAALFTDSRLSGSGRIACSTCHRPDQAFTDGLARGEGASRGDRNTLTLLDVGGQRWYGWDGANDSLWSQSLRPIVDPS